MALPFNENLRAKYLLAEVNYGRKGYGDELNQVDTKNPPLQRVEKTEELQITGGTGTRIATEREETALKLKGIDHALAGEFYMTPETTLELGAEAWRRASEAAVSLSVSHENPVQEMAQRDKEFVESRLPHVRADLAKIRNK